MANLFTYTCLEVTLMHEKLQEGKLSLKERLAYRVHLWYCSYCRRFVKQWQQIKRLVGKDSAGNLEANPRSGFIEQLQNTVERHANSK